MSMPDKDDLFAKLEDIGEVDCEEIENWEEP